MWCTPYYFNKGLYAIMQEGARVSHTQHLLAAGCLALLLLLPLLPLLLLPLPLLLLLPLLLPVGQAGGGGRPRRGGHTHTPHTYTHTHTHAPLPLFPCSARLWLMERSHQSWPPRGPRR